MSEQLITRADAGVGEGVFDSIAWLFSEHIKQADMGIFKSAVLYGNEDCPDKADLYLENSPLITSNIAGKWVAGEGLTLYSRQRPEGVRLISR